MNRTTAAAPSIGFLVLTLLALAWQAWGLVDLFRTGRFGYSVDADNIVQQVSPQSPAATAGLQSGDQLLAIDGLSMDDPAVANRPRTRVGTRIRLRVERQGQPHRLALTAGPLPVSLRVTSWVNTAIGLAFLIAAWVVRRQRRTAAAALFGWLSLTAALLFAWTPWLGGGLVGLAVGWLLNVLVLVASALFVHLTWYLPRPRPLLRRRGLVPALYAPAVVDVGLALGALLLADATGGVFAIVAGYLNQWLPRVFLLLALGFIVASFVSGDRAERRSNGLGLLLAGTVAAVIPFVVLGIIGPGMSLPPGIASLSLLLLPAALAVAVLRATPPNDASTHGGESSAHSSRVSSS